jgi:hypothetical protein
MGSCCRSIVLVPFSRVHTATRRRGFGTYVIVTLTVIAIVAADGDGKHLCLKTGVGVPYPKVEYVVTIENDGAS